MGFESWRDAPTWVRDKWTNLLCAKDPDVLEGLCNPWMSCCQMVEEYGIKAGYSWGSAPQSIKTKWENKHCDEQDDVKRKSCRTRGMFDKLSISSLF